MSDNQSKSILLQVAFKEAARFADGSAEAKAVAERTREFYSSLLTLHDEFGIELKDRQYGGSGGGSRKPAEKKELPAGASVFNHAGTSWVDFRKAKVGGAVKPRHPDFKSFDNKNSEWMEDPEGNPNGAIKELVAAADAATF